MKKKKSRLIVSLLTAFIMAFTVFPYMGAGSQVSAEEDPYIQKYTSSQSTPITQVKFIPDGNGTFGIELTIDYEVYDNEHWQKIEAMSMEVIDADSDQYYVNMSTSASGGRGTFTWEASEAKIVPGRVIFILFTFGEDYYGDYPLNNVSWQGFYTSVPQLKPADCIHSWDTGTVTKAATCAATGVKTLKCTVCSTTKTETIPKSTTHSYSEGTCTVCGVNDPSITANGTYTKTTNEIANPNDVMGSYEIVVKKNQRITLDWDLASGYLSGMPAIDLYNKATNEYIKDGTRDGFTYKFEKAGTYVIEVYNTGWTKSKFVITYTLKDAYVPSNKYKTCTITKKKDSTANGHYIQIDAKNLDYQDPDNTDSQTRFDEAAVMQSPIHIYRFCGNTVKLITVLEGITSRATSMSYNDYATLDKTYSYYVIKDCVVDDHFTSADKLPSKEGSSVTLTATQRTALTTKLAKYGNKAVVAGGTATTITMPKPAVATVKDFKLYVHKDVPKYRRLMWDNNSNGGITGYIVKRYNSSGKLIKNYGRVKMSAPDTIGEARKYYVPYSSNPDKYTAYFTVTPYYYYNGKYYDGKETSKIKTKSVRIKAPTAKITKISNSKAKITINKASNSAGTIIYQYTGGKWKKIGSTTGTKYTVTYNKSKGSSKTPGKVKYKFKSYLTDNGSTFYSDSYSTSYSPLSNYKSWNYSKYQSDYKDYSHFWKPMKIYYSNGKVKLTGRWINTHNYRLDYFNIKVTVKCDGKVIGTKTLKCGKMAANSTKTHSAVTISTKAGYDLRNGNTTITYKVISWY